jgi:hypothetical protein
MLERLRRIARHGVKLPSHLSRIHIEGGKEAADAIFAPLTPMMTFPPLMTRGAIVMV